MALEPLVVEQRVTYKRYALLKYLDAKARDQAHLAGVWRAQLAALPLGTPLPVTFPFIPTLVAAGYSEREHLEGATTAELMRELGVGQTDAEAILTAATALPVIP